MSKDKVVELGRHKPTTDSVIERIDRHRSKIKGITAVLTYEDGSCDLTYNTKPLTELAYDALLLTTHVQDSMKE